MKRHIMTSMSGGYNPVILKHQVELREAPQVKVCIKVFRTRLYGTPWLKDKSESALIANINEHPCKKFKGVGRISGKIRNKANDAVC